MPASDSIHDAVVNALRNDGWAITDDPLTLEFGGLYLFVDVGAEQTVIAERGLEKIAVEIKSFPSKSMVADLQQAVGQYVVYRSFLRRIEEERALYLAVSSETYERVFEPPPGQLVREDVGIRLVVIDVGREEVVSWIT
jgi:hypothetical protein